MTDELLIKGLRLGKKSAQERFYKANYRKVLGLCYQILRNLEDAEDAAQQSLFIAISKIDKFKGDSKLESWLYRITYNESLMMLRDRRAHNRRLAEAQQKPVFHTEQTADPIHRRTIQKAFSAIRPDYRALILQVLRFGLVDQSKTKSALKCSLHKARKHLKETYSEAA